MRGRQHPCPGSRLPQAFFCGSQLRLPMKFNDLATICECGCNCWRCGIALPALIDLPFSSARLRQNLHCFLKWKLAPLFINTGARRTVLSAKRPHNFAALADGCQRGDTMMLGLLCIHPDGRRRSQWCQCCWDFICRDRLLRHAAADDDDYELQGFSVESSTILCNNEVS